MNNVKIGFGGGCHWCTEAVFASLAGIEKVKQGWISSIAPNELFSEAVLMTYDSTSTNLKDFIHVHLLTHASTSNHSMRHKYRSAIYYFNENDKFDIEQILNELQPEFDHPLIVQVLPFVEFKSSLPEHLNYYYANPEKPFCQVYINPKLQMLREKFSHLSNGNNKF